MSKERVYAECDLVLPAMRDNNIKRPYLFVNPLQGKHVPVHPAKALALFESLAGRLYARQQGEKLLITGFAETATAIGSALACLAPDGAIRTPYIHTTREMVPGADYLYFSEDHSHASEQKLVSNRLAQYIADSDRIVFVEDEVTTGNTILNLIHVLKERYPGGRLKFGIASILNGMTADIRRSFEDNGIACICIADISVSDYAEKLTSRRIHPAQMHPAKASCSGTYRYIAIPGRIDPRAGVLAEAYAASCQALARSAAEQALPDGVAGKRILVLGSEEFMYAPLITAAYIEGSGSNSEVFFHATTRSPILPSEDDGYPLFSRYELKSLYDPERTIYIYNLRPYDQVIVIHDSRHVSDAGIRTLVHALNSSGNYNITIIEWKDSENADLL